MPSSKESFAEVMQRYAALLVVIGCGSFVYHATVGRVLLAVALGGRDWFLPNPHTHTQTHTCTHNPRPGT